MFVDALASGFIMEEEGVRVAGCGCSLFCCRLLLVVSMQQSAGFLLSASSHLSTRVSLNRGHDSSSLSYSWVLLTFHELGEGLDVLLQKY